MIKVTDPCPHCRLRSLAELLEQEGSKHYARLQCLSCNSWIAWIKKPENIDKRPANKHIKNLDYCELCLRYSDELKSGIEEHHIWSYSTNPELDNVVNNRLSLCAQCHVIIERIQEYCGTRRRKKRNENE